jgi:DNA-binding NarL/FixJ family response regulator
MTEASPVRVLVVDDEPDIRLLLRMQLSLFEDLEVFGVAEDGNQAIEFVRTARPDVVVMDLLMPSLNGFAGIAILQDEFPDVGIVAYTGVAGDFVREEMGRREVEIVLKSGDAQPLADAIRRSFTKARTNNVLD